jgi:uncharacterized membrane protein YtjA (UPF0391 family)
MPKEPRRAPPSEDGFTGASATVQRVGFYFFWILFLSGIFISPPASAKI